MLKFIVVLIIFIAFVIKLTEYICSTRYEEWLMMIEPRFRKYSSEISRLKAKNKDLEYEINKLKSDNRTYMRGEQNFNNKSE